VEALADADEELASARACKLTLEQDFNSPALAGTKSLPGLATDFGGGHEAIRGVRGPISAV